MIKAVGMSSSGAAKQFTGTDFTGALFRDVDLTDATITGLIDGLTVNEIEVAPLVAAELDRRHPELVLFRSEEPSDLARGWRIVRDQLLRTIDRVDKLSLRGLRLGVNGEWSSLETLRHLVFVADDWHGRTVLADRAPYWPGGLMPSFLNHPDRLGIDASADPDLDQVLTALNRRLAQLDVTFSNVFGQLQRRAFATGHRPSLLAVPARGVSAHCRYIERDRGLSS